MIAFKSSLELFPEKTTVTLSFSQDSNFFETSAKTLASDSTHSSMLLIEFLPFKQFFPSLTGCLLYGNVPTTTPSSKITFIPQPTLHDGHNVCLISNIIHHQIFKK